MPTRHRPHPLGVRPREDGVDVAVLASQADHVDFCVLRPGRGGQFVEERVALPSQTHGVWHGFVPGVGVGDRYGLRVHGRWEPHRGLRHNPAKLLLDPYARAVEGPVVLRPELFGHTVGADLIGDTTTIDHRDSAPYAPHGVVVAPGRPRTARPRIPWADTIVYEAHVRGLTMNLPGVPQELRGTYAGLAHPATVEYLVNLGVTTLELLPVHAISDEPSLARRGLPNYWGYSTLGYFAPHAGYAASRTALGTVAEFREMVDTLHDAGLEVILDVVYNHTCEAGVDGPTLSFRGLDAATYYRLDAYGRDVDSTGCGNSLDFSHARVVQLTLDSLRYWVEDLGVDGFRFDLATTLARGRDGFDPDHPFLVAARADPVLADVKLVAEPWDVGPHGWRTGQFPPPFSEWNDRFRDSVREFWLAGAARAAAGWATGGVRDLATRLAGSADVFAALRGPTASVNFITAHDGFTAHDLTAYDVKHNEDNGEDNRDGSGDNRSWNHGVEGQTSDEAITAARHRSLRNLLGTLLLSTGVPMLVAGDEFGRTQGGNNNPYCQDNEISWVDWQWQPWQADLLESVRFLVHLRRTHPVLRQERFFAGRPVHPDGTKDLAWFGPDGAEMDHARWHDAGLRTLQMYLHAVEGGYRATPSGPAAPPSHHADESLLMILHGAGEAAEVALPSGPWGRGYRLLWDSALPLPPAGRSPVLPAGAGVQVEPLSMRVYAVIPVHDHGRKPPA
ncbi:MAG: glycogen debranching protein GlgX [Kineosporiaceae bacterium]